jgi:hypothetical protein
MLREPAFNFFDKESTMIQFDPPVLVKPLSDVQPGSFVRGENAQRVAICIISTGDPHKRKTLVIHDAQAHRFTWEHADNPTVVSYESDVIVKPDVGSFHPELTATVSDTLYTFDASPYLIVAMGNGIRFVNLASGELQSRQSWPMMGSYRRWTAGVRGMDGRFIELLSVSQYGAAFEQDSIEPE